MPKSCQTLSDFFAQKLLGSSNSVESKELAALKRHPMTSKACPNGSKLPHPVTLVSQARKHLLRLINLLPLNRRHSSGPSCDRQSCRITSPHSEAISVRALCNILLLASASCDHGAYLECARKRGFIPYLKKIS